MSLRCSGNLDTVPQRIKVLVERRRLAGETFDPRTRTLPRSLELGARGDRAAEAGHFRGDVYAWDAVNEPLNEDGTLNQTIWERNLGPGYIADALRWAHRADPTAKLYLNDYNLEWIGPKSNAMYELVKSLKAADVPIDGVGFQGHLGIQYGFPGDIAQNIKRFTDLGVEVSITELVRMILPVTDEKLATQADYYRQVVAACTATRAVSARRCGASPTGTRGCPRSSLARERPASTTSSSPQSPPTSRCSTSSASW